MGNHESNENNINSENNEKTEILTDQAPAMNQINEDEKIEVADIESPYCDVKCENSTISEEKTTDILLTNSKNNTSVQQQTNKAEDKTFHPSKKSKQTIEKEDYNDQKTRVYQPIYEDPSVTFKREVERKKEAKRHGRFVILTAFLVICVLLEFFVGFTGIILINRMVSDAPELKATDFIGEESTRIFDDSGDMIAEVGVYLRENILYDKCPESLVDAFLAVEDSRFFTHFGFDIPRFSKAMIENIKARNFSQGGSTFTMQLVKNTYFSIDAGDKSQERKKSIDYKVQQIYLSIKLEKMLSKKEIFQLYMNKLNFGGNIRGVQKASLYYFGKNCTELNLSESALLAGIINLPNGYNPYYNLDNATKRRNDVLKLMRYHGYITDEEYDLAHSIKIEDQLIGEIKNVSTDSKYQSYIDVVLNEVQRLTGLDPTVKGMQIYTYMNPTIQTEIENIQNGNTPIQFADDLMQVAMIAMDNKNGAIVGIGGGRNYDGGARLLNRATMNFKQPGSVVKPVLSYALAFEYLGYSLDELLVDKPITYPFESRVLVNATGKYDGDVSLKDAMGKSLNIPAILTLQKVTDKIGKEKVANYMNAIGFTKVNADNFHLSFAIGGTWFESTVAEVAGAHSMIINGGVYNEPHTIEHVILSDGTNYYPENQNRKVLSPGSAWLTSELMANNVNETYWNYMEVLRRNYPVYAKTGTTDWGSDGVRYGIPKGAIKDKWMASSTSKYTNCVWLGYDLAVSGKGTYFNAYKNQLNLPGQINKRLLDIEEKVTSIESLAGIKKPEDIKEIKYVYGSYPHVREEEGMNPGALITSEVSKAGLEAQPLISSEEFREYIAKQQNTGSFSISASYDQYSTLKVTWGAGNSLCSGDSRNISLHDKYNDIDMWGACLADLNWLTGTENAGSYWATVYIDDAPVAQISSIDGLYSGWAADLWGTVKVCGGSATGESACTVAHMIPIQENW